MIASTVALFLYAKGYSYNRQSRSLEKTGMIIAKSVPDGARVYLNGQLTQATNANLTGLTAGLYSLRLEKDGFSTFQKEVPVKEELATTVEVVLIPLNPELRPLTKTGVKSPTLAQSRDKILFLTSDRDKPGLWSLTLTGNIFSLIKGNLELVAADQDKAALSRAEKIYLSPTDESALIRMNQRGYYLLDLTANKIEPTATAAAKPSLEKWQLLSDEKKKSLSLKYKVPKNIQETATDSATLWSPDERRFLYALPSGKQLEYHVYDTSDPLGVGEKEDNTTLNLPKTQKTKITWFSDSRHLITATCEVETKEEACLSGSIHLIRIDGTNKTQIYSGALSLTDVFPTPDGSKIIILTSFNQNAEPNLSAIVLR